MKILIVDDHPLIVDAYIRAIGKVKLPNPEQVVIKVASSCDRAIFYAKKQASFDLVVLDICLPPSKDKSFLSGECVGLYFRKKHPNCKIMICTSLNDNYRIYTLLKSLSPDSFLVKSDITLEDLIMSIQRTMDNLPFYSSTILRYLRKETSHKLLLDEIDRKLLYELSRGTKMKDLPHILPLSIGGVERRKRQLKEIFSIENNSDIELMRNAREKGFI